MLKKAGNIEVLERVGYLNQAVTHALDLLEQFRDETVELGVTELSNLLHLPKNNIFRLLATLQMRGYIDQNPATGNYHLGVKALDLGQTFIRQSGLLKQARPALEELVAACNETCYLTVYRQGFIFYLDVLETRHAVRVVSRVGSRLPAYCTASGKVFLANASEEELELLYPGGTLQPLTSTTHADTKSLAKDVQGVIRMGYALDDEECEPGVRCVASPIRDYMRKVVGAMSISGPSFRIGLERTRQELAPLVMRAAQNVSVRIGYQP